MTDFSSKWIVAIVGLFTVIIGALMIVFTKDGPIITCIACGQTGTTIIGVISVVLGAAALFVARQLTTVGR